MSAAELPRLVRQRSIQGGWSRGGGYYYEWFAVWPDGRKAGPYPTKRQARNAFPDAQD